MRTRIASFSGLAVGVALIFGGAAPAWTQQVVKFGEGQTLTISGFINATMYTDHGLFTSFGQGQNAAFAACPVLPTPGCTTAQPVTDKTFSDGDFRNTRLNFTFAGSPVLGKWAPRATVEFDFFAPPDLAPPFQDEQPRIRGRLIFADLTNGRSTFRIGQFWSPSFAEVPVSLTHIAFPIGYGASGEIGWRFPGIFFYQDLSAAGAPLNVQLQLAVMKGSGPAAAGSDATNNIGSGEASGLPQLEARFNFAKKSANLSWSAYVVGHLDWKDTTGTGRDTTSTGAQDSNLSAWGIEGGGSINPGRFTLHGNVYYGKALGQLFAHITQTGPAGGDIRGWGAWAQAGYDFDPHWSLWGYYGLDQPNLKRFTQDYPTATLARQSSHEGDALLRFRAGRYALGLEYYRSVVRWSTGPAHAEQYALSVLYTL
jgi:hypothetical protein